MCIYLIFVFVDCTIIYIGKNISELLESIHIFTHHESIQSISSNKSTPKGDIPARVLKYSIGYFFLSVKSESIEKLDKRKNTVKKIKTIQQ